MSKLKAVAELFEGRHFDREVVILCVRWYLRFKLSLRDLIEMMAERSVTRWSANGLPALASTQASLARIHCAEPRRHSSTAALATCGQCSFCWGTKRLIISRVGLCPVVVS
jgi:hypothetical protein